MSLRHRLRPAWVRLHRWLGLLLGAWFVLQGGLFLLAVVALAARLARLARPGPWPRVLQAAGGLLFIALALRILKERPIGS